MEHRIADEAGAQSSNTRPVSSRLLLLPGLLVVVSVLLTFVRIYTGGDHFPGDAALMMLALAGYLAAAIFSLSYFFAPLEMSRKAGIVLAYLGVFLNLLSWLFRWVAAYERELAIFTGQGRDLAEMPWLFRYIPFANLYDLSVAFAFGAGLTTIILFHNRKLHLVAALSLPLAALILILARFIGADFVDLPPVLDSYWRPIHVGVASLSYGVALVCFAAAVLYLLKDGLKSETVAIWASIFSLAVIATIGNFAVLSPETFGVYSSSVLLGSTRMPVPLRAEVPGTGPLLAFSAFLFAGVIALGVVALRKKTTKFASLIRSLLIIAMLAQGAAVGVLLYQLKTIEDPVNYIDSKRLADFAVWRLQQENTNPTQIAAMSKPQLEAFSRDWVERNGFKLMFSINANPVELAALITALFISLFAVLYGFRTEAFRQALPSLQSLDDLMYKLGGLAFVGLALLLMTGAVWANESWGRYWGWDSKETGALVAWLTYAAFLHSRITHGWKGRRTAYFAILAFLFVIFTYLGVSYLLPGLHSYA